MTTDSTPPRLWWDGSDFLYLVADEALASHRDRVPGFYRARTVEGIPDDAVELRPVAPETVEPPHVPRRDDAVATWLKQMRDRDREAGYDAWTVLDFVLDEYRLHSDTGTPLDRHACAGSYCGAASPLPTDTEETP